MAPPKKKRSTPKTIVRKKRTRNASAVSDEKAQDDCRKRGGVWFPATATQSSFCIVYPMKPSKLIVINRYRGDPCMKPVDPRERFILVPPTKELTDALLDAIKPSR